MTDNSYQINQIVNRLDDIGIILKDMYLVLRVMQQDRAVETEGPGPVHMTWEQNWLTRRSNLDEG